MSIGIRLSMRKSLACVCARIPKARDALSVACAERAARSNNDRPEVRARASRKS
jgi:hypothetical protein